MTNHSFILTLCSNTPYDHRTPADVGHVWLQIERAGRPMESFGLFPSKVQMLADGMAEGRQALPFGYTRGNAVSDVQRNIEVKISKRYKLRQSIRWALNEEKGQELMALIAQPKAYSRVNYNCADWAYDIVRKLAGHDFQSKNWNHLQFRKRADICHPANWGR